MSIFGLFKAPDVPRLAAQRDIEGLIKALQYKKNYAIRKQAALALAETKDARVISPLVSALNDQLIKEDVFKALRGIAQQAVVALIEVLKDKSAFENGRMYGVILLQEARDIRTIPLFISILGDPRENSIVRSTAAKALGQLRDERVLPALLVALKDNDHYVRWGAANGLGKLMDERAAPDLYLACSDKDENVRVAAFEALRELPDLPDSVRSQMPILETEARRVKSAQAETSRQVEPSKNWPKTDWGVKDINRGGLNDVRIRNGHDFKVLVGLRLITNDNSVTAWKGEDFTVNPKDSHSVYVPAGKYEIYFQYDNDVDGLYKGDDFTLLNSRIEIKLVKVPQGNYSIRRIS